MLFLSLYFCEAQGKSASSKALGKNLPVRGAHSVAFKRLLQVHEKILSAILDYQYLLDGIDR